MTRQSLSQFFIKTISWVGIGLVMCVVMAVSLGCSEQEYASQQVKNTTAWAIGFPPMRDAEQRAFTAPILKELNVKSIRFNEEWRYREPEDDIYNWQPLDARVAWAVENDIDIMLTIQANGPDWACAGQNELSCVYSRWDKFQEYMENLVQRYPDGITKIQFGNEWQTEHWYIGTAEDYVRANNMVYQAVQTYNPDIEVVLGGFSTTALAYMAGCAGDIDGFYDHNSIWIDAATLAEQCQMTEYLEAKEKVDYIMAHALYDKVDIHLYDDVENWTIYYDHMLSLSDKPIIVSEFGGPNLDRQPQDEEYQAQQLTKYLHTINALGIKEAYYFKLVEGSMNPVHKKSGLIRLSDLKKKKSYDVFMEFSQRNK